MKNIHLQKLITTICLFVESIATIFNAPFVQIGIFLHNYKEIHPFNFIIKEIV